MIHKILQFSLLHPFSILLFTLVVAGCGVYSFTRLLIDALPNITNNQVQINTLLTRYSPAQIEEQVTYVIETALDQTKLVNGTIDTISKNLIEGAILVIAVLLIFLGYFRAALIAALVIPLSILMTATGMVQAKISDNLMSLGAIDFALILDGAIIITENCLRRLAQKQHALGRVLNFEERSQEVLIASREMIQPSVFGQGIIITVYIPILMLTGVEGKMFNPMAMTIIFALISAFILSLTFVPAMIALFVKGHLSEKENFLVAQIKRPYQFLLEQSLQAPWLITTLALITVAFAFSLFPRLGEEFIPTLDEKEISEKVFVPGAYWITWGGQFENLIAVHNRLFFAVPICFALIFILLYTALNSIRYAFVVFTGLPLALTGGIFSLWVREMPFSITAAIGFIALSGIAVLNGLVLVTYINQLRKEGVELEKAIVQAALTRLRPVLMTALVASLGFIPMALANGIGAEVQKPLASVVIGGLISSTLLTLIVLPALYLIFSTSFSSIFEFFRQTKLVPVRIRIRD